MLYYVEERIYRLYHIPIALRVIHHCYFPNTRKYDGQYVLPKVMLVLDTLDTPPSLPRRYPVLPFIEHLSTVSGAVVKLMANVSVVELSFAE